MKKYMVISGRLKIILILISMWLTSNSFALAKRQFIAVTTNEITDISLVAQNEYNWWIFPVKALFRHKESGTEITIWGFWNGDKSWILRFRPISDGDWVYTTSSTDPGLNNIRGVVKSTKPTERQVRCNPNHRGQIRISRDGRYFEYADGTPFFLLGDTGWGINTMRCGIGESKNGPFYQYLEDRKSKGFTAIILKHIRGTGDTQDSAAQRNEGGYPFALGEEKSLNPEYFRYLDIRVKAIWENGFVHAMPVAWFGKRKCFFSFEEAKRISAYFMVRYGAYNGIFALGGEYQYAFRDCAWEPEAYNELGRIVQSYNSYKKPVSIHPSSGTEWKEPHNVQSSRPYHNSGWLDHNWLQTGQSIPQLYNVVTRSLENYNLNPVRPVFLAEAYYEKVVDTDHVYHSRWQPWNAFLNGSAGYGYGAWGIWDFFDPYDPLGEKGESVNSLSGILPPWWEAIQYGGSAQMKYVNKLLHSLRWWKLVPHREWILVNGLANTLPTASDITPPSCASITDELFIVYIPRGNSEKKIEIDHLGQYRYRATWYNLRSGISIPIKGAIENSSRWEIPARIEPNDEDWVLVVIRV